MISDINSLHSMESNPDVDCEQHELTNEVGTILKK